MEFIKKDLMYLLGFCMIFYYFNSKTEKMSNTDIKKIIQEEYKIDVDAIRNLSKLANDLTANNRLIVPGGLEIAGPLKIGNVNIKQNGEIHARDFHGRSFNGQAGSYVRYGDDFVLSTNIAGTPSGKHYIIYDDNNNVRKHGSGAYGYSNIANQGYQIHRARNRR